MMIFTEGCAWEGERSGVTGESGAQCSPERGLRAQLLLGKLTPFALFSGT